MGDGKPGHGPHLLHWPDNRVMVYKFIISGSLEENVDRMIREKARLAEDIKKLVSLQ